VYVFERDCSVQRRHQKVIEEAPAPNMDPKMRRAMGEAAVAAAKAVAYVGAGTVEFIVEPDGRFYFMEMNTRLQVEHPVTEMITGIDLVEWQLRVAAGESLPLNQEQLQLSGHAIEARIYAENTENGFLPSVGRLTHVQLPDHVAFANGLVRVDGSVRCGDDISPYYDPMIAKLIVWGATREQALARMQQALAETQIVGVHTNINFLSRLIADESFALADLDTGLIERRREKLLPPPSPSADHVLGCAVAAILSEESAESSFQTQHQQTVVDPWSIQDGWRLNGTYRRRFVWLDGQAPRQVELLGRVGHQRLEIDGRSHDFGWSGQRLTSGAYLLELRLGGVRRAATVQQQGERVDVFVEGIHTMLCLQDPLKQALHKEAGQTGGLTAPMPGKIIAVHITEGQTVRQGDALLVMEAMKMEYTIRAPQDGVIVDAYFQVGDQVKAGDELVEFQPLQEEVA
jgi:3-methylcrotonyl-CoA carboxylase alpha subunit